MVDVMAITKSMTVSLFEAKEPNIKEWLIEISNFNRKIVDSYNRALHPKESGLLRDEFEEIGIFIIISLWLGFFV